MCCALERYFEYLDTLIPAHPASVVITILKQVEADIIGKKQVNPSVLTISSSLEEEEIKVQM